MPYCPSSREPRARRVKLRRRERAPNGAKPCAQFLSVMTVARGAPNEPSRLSAVGLTDRRARANHLAALASSVARSAHVIQSTKGRRKFIGLGQGALPGGLSRPINVEDGPEVPLSIEQTSGLLVGRERPAEQIGKSTGRAGLRRVPLSTPLKSGTAPNGRGTAHAQTGPWTGRQTAGAVGRTLPACALR